MESYTASFVMPGLLAEEPEPVAISWVGGRRSRDVESRAASRSQPGEGCVLLAHVGR